MIRMPSSNSNTPAHYHRKHERPRDASRSLSTIRSEPRLLLRLLLLGLLGLVLGDLALRRLRLLLGLRRGRLGLRRRLPLLALLLVRLDRRRRLGRGGFALHDQ